jgi:3-methyladenine DNA glycosylase AlkD
MTPTTRPSSWRSPAAHREWRAVTVVDQRPTARSFVRRLEAVATFEERDKLPRYFKSGVGDYGEGDEFLGVRMGTVFGLVGEFRAMELHEVEALLESPIHEARAGAVKIMAKQAAAPGVTDDQRRALVELYLRRIDRINNWDLVDLGAWDVVGRYLDDKPRDVLSELAGSADRWLRRTAILATLFFVRHDDLDDAFVIAEQLVADDEDLVRKAVGGVLRECGKHDAARLRGFLDRHAMSMPRTTLRYAVERLDPADRAHYRSLRAPESSS